MRVYLPYLAFPIFNTKYFESDSVKLQIYHHSFHLTLQLVQLVQKHSCYQRGSFGAGRCQNKSREHWHESYAESVMP